MVYVTLWDDSPTIKQTEKMNGNTYKTEKPAAQTARLGTTFRDLVLPHTQADPSQNQKALPILREAIFFHRTKEQ